MSQIHIDLRTLHAALGGVISGGQVLCAGPNHSKKDRSLAVKPTANGIVTYSFAGDDWLDCRDYVHDRLTFSYPDARSTRTAWDGHQEGIGVCRDFAHLSIALCRCMNIPARYCTGYLGDIGVPPVPDPMDFSAWFEVLLEGGWYTFDARHNKPRIGRILIARGRDAADVALSTSFGAAQLAEFKVITEEQP